MLYPTHKKFGYLFGLTGLVIAFLNGWLLSMASVSGFGNKVYVFAVVYIAIRGAVFGASYPDIDSPGSVPARHYPFIRRLFKLFNVKHRGKFSHDYIVVTLTFTVIYIILSTLIKMGQYTSYISMVLAIYLSYVVARDLVNNLMFYLVKDRKQRKIAITLGKPIVAVVVLVIFQVLGVIQLGDSNLNRLVTLNFVGPLLKVYVVFGLVGAISHLFADMLTNEGVWVLGKKVAPAQVLLVVRKIPLIGKWFLKNEMKTGTDYEDGWRFIVTILIIPMVLLMLYGLVGGDLGQVLHLIRG